MRPPRFLPGTVSLCAALLAGACSGMPFGDPGASSPPLASAPAAPPVAMAGRWRLASGHGGSCAMTFTAPTPAEGTIAPEGGCPANFFTSRRWVFEQGVLVVQDHTRKPLAMLRQNGGHFEGEIGNREMIRLER